MKKIVLSTVLFFTFYAPQALADIPSGGDKTGCSAVGTFDIGNILLPVLLLGLLSFFQKPKKNIE